MDREAAHKRLLENEHPGWQTLLDIVYDNKPDHITITEVFQKWGALKFDYDGDDDDFKYLLETVARISEHMCETCGKSARLTVIDGWETTLCDLHYDTNKANQKFRPEK